MLGNFPAVFRFELRRALTVSRIAWWCALTGFPIVLTSLIRMIPTEIPPEAWYGFMFALIPMLVSILGTFLWTTAAVSAEVERESWVYLAVRPGGRTAVVLGKYLAAIIWVLPSALLSLAVCVAIIWTDSDFLHGGSYPGEQAVELWILFAKLSCLSVPAYGALYLALGLIFTKRSMVIAVAYTLVFELLVSFIPAIINKLTIQHRLLALFLNWSEIDLGEEAGRFLSTQVLGPASPARHVVILIAYTISLVLLSVFLVRRREYAGAGMGDS